MANLKMCSLLKITVLTLLMLFMSWMVSSVEDMDYSDLESMGVSCYPKDTCDRPVPLAFKNRSCECDRKCHRFNDCCIDVEINPPRNRVSVPNTECSEFDVDWGVYTVTTCPTTWSADNDIRSKCEDNADLSNPLAAAPTTDISSNITYMNHYCAQCNNAQASNLRSWNIDIECSKMPNVSTVDAAYVENHLVFATFDDNEDTWGFYYPESSSGRDGGRQFYSCNVPFRLPNTLRRHVRECRPHLISTCAVDWNRSIIRRKCQDYTAIIYVGSHLYKNPHCALCNHQNVSRRLCNIPGGIIIRDKKPPLSFTVLMDVNMSDGNRVGEIRDDRCRGRKKWDPFAKRCRSTACAIPGYRVVNGVCVQP